MISPLTPFFFQKDACASAKFLNRFIDDERIRMWTCQTVCKDVTICAENLEFTWFLGYPVLFLLVIILNY